MIGWCVHKDAGDSGDAGDANAAHHYPYSVQICLSDMQKNPLKLFDSSDNIPASKGSIWFGKITKLHQGGAFIDAANSPLFLRRAHNLCEGDSVLMQIQTPAHSGKLPRGSTRIMLENHYWRYRPDIEDMIFAPSLTRGRDNIALCDSIRKWHDKNNFHGLELKASASGKPLALLGTQANQLITDYQKILQRKAQNFGLINPSMDVVKRALIFPITKIFAGSQQALLLMKDEAQKMGMDIPITYHREAHDYLQEALEMRASQNHHHQGAEIIIQRTNAVWAIDINSGRARPASRKPELIALEINQSLIPSIIALIYLKNIHGTIVIDFITMRQKLNLLKILTSLKAEAKRIAILLGEKPLTLHGWTRAGLFEIQTG